MQYKTQIVSRKNDMTLVEWREDDYPFRAWVTPDMIVSESGKEIIVEEPGAGIPYGMEWRHLVTLSATPTAVERELRRVGIWTVSDLRAKPNEARSALQAVYGYDMAALFNAVKVFEKSMEV